MYKSLILIAAMGAFTCMAGNARATTIPYGVSAVPSQVTLVAGGCGRGWRPGLERASRRWIGLF